jgi:CheY-like chemotaxis protein
MESLVVSEAGLRARFKVSTDASIVALDRAVAAWLAGTLSDDLRHAAAMQAHTLAGSLTMFGFRGASALAWALNDELEAADARNVRSARHCANVLVVLREELRDLPAGPRPESASDRSPWDASSSGGRARTDARADERVQQARVLVAAADDTIAAVLERALEPAGHELVRATTAFQAVQLAGHRRFDVILLDLQLHGMDGPATCRALRAVEHASDVPILMLAARDDRADVLDGLAEGATDYIMEPFPAAQVRARIQSWVAREANR